MAKGRLIKELDQAVERIIKNPGGHLPDVDSRMRPLIRVAAELLDLPAAGFKTRLEGELLGLSLTRSRAAMGETTRAQVGIAGQAEVANQAGGLRFLGTLDECTVGLARVSDQKQHWERHPGEELLHVLEGELEVTTLSDAGPVHTRVAAGSIFVCPRGLWHWPRPKPMASLLFVTPEKGTEISRAKDPRSSRRARKLREDSKGTTGRTQQGLRPASRASKPELVARDVRGALMGIPKLAISAATSAEEAVAAFPKLGSLNKCGLYAGRFSGLSPWERHPSADELLHILEGEVEITTLTDRGPVRNSLRAGSVFVCPRGLWHRQYSADGVLEFSATPQPTEISFADDPRV